MARLLGSAMISNTDSTLLVYSAEYMRVKVKKGRGPGKCFSLWGKKNTTFFFWGVKEKNPPPRPFRLRRGKGPPPSPPPPPPPHKNPPSRRFGQVSLDEAEHFLHNRDASVATLRWCSGSSRNAVRNHPGFSVRLRRNPQRAGINFIDTADSYGPGVSEEIIAEALHPYPTGLVIATKGGFVRPGPNQWVENGKPEHLRSACEGSLRRLRLDRIDLYQLHRIDPKVPAEDQLGTLKDLQAQGKIKHIGLSEVSVKQIQHARTIVPIVSVQNRYSITDRGSEDVLEYCEKEKIGFIPWFPLAAGRVSGSESPISRIAARWKATPSQVALAWLLVSTCISQST